jgi:arylsulfatase A-like enzyme
MTTSLLSWLACQSQDPEKPARDRAPPEQDDDDDEGDDDDETQATGDTAQGDGLVHVGGLAFEEDLPRNLLVVSVDTTRRDYLSYFSGDSVTPNLDRVLEESYVLANHRSCSNWTGPSMTCIASGKTAYEVGFWWGSYYVPSLPPDGAYEPTARLLGELGFHSTVVTTNTAFFTTSAGTTYGFEREVPQPFYSADLAVPTALSELDALMVPGDPWYLHVHFFDPHGSYCPPYEYVDAEEYHEGAYYDDLCTQLYPLIWYGSFWYLSPEEQQIYLENAKLLYEGELRFWDTWFGTFWSELEARGALDDTLVVFVTDHGEQFAEHGGFFHGVWMGSEENRATAAFWSRNLQPGVWDGVTVHQDVAATIQAVFGATPTLPQSGIVAGTGDPARVVSAFNLGWPSVVSVASADRQLVYDWWGGKSFYRLDTDPEGVVNVYDPTDPEVLALWAELDVVIDDLLARWPWLGPPYLRGP